MFGLFRPSVRPSVSGVDDHSGASLHQVQATGAFNRFRAVAAGGDGQTVTSRLAKSVQTLPVKSTLPENEPFPVTKTGEEGEGGGGGRGGRERRSLSPEIRSVLKRALSALWEDEDGGGGGDGFDDDGKGKGNGEGGMKSAGKWEGDSTKGSDDGERRSRRHTGGMTAFELSATVYGARDSLPLPRRHNGGKAEGGEGGDGSDVVFPAWGEADWKKGFACSDGDLEAVLLELEGEELEARKRAKGTGERT